jgi:hypothetical protein
MEGHMAYFRKKPTVVEARQMPRAPVSEVLPPEARALARWCGGAILTNTSSGEWCIDIMDSDITMRALPGDWILKDAQGFFQPCKPNIFDATYEFLED